MSSRLFSFSYAKPDREKEEKAEKKRIEAEKADKERIEKEKLFSDIKSIYQDIKNKFPDIDIDFYIMCLNPQENQKYRYDKLYNIDLQTLNYNKYIAYKLLELMYEYDNNNNRINRILISEYILSRMPPIAFAGYRHAPQKIILNSKAFIKELDSKIFMDNVNIQWTILQHAIKNNLFKTSPKPSPKPSPKTSPKTSPKPSPKASAKSSSPKTSPKASPKTSSPKTSPKASAKSSSPKTSPKPSPKASAKSSSPKTSPKASPKTSSPKTSPKASAKSSSPKASPKASAKSSSSKVSPINRDDMAELSMEELFAKLAKK